MQTDSLSGVCIVKLLNHISQGAGILKVEIKSNKTHMGIILWIIFGAIVGWVASLIMKTDDQQGAVLNIVVGIVGALIGGWTMTLFGYGGITGFNLYSFAVSLLGAILLIAIVKGIRSAGGAGRHGTTGRTV